MKAITLLVIVSVVGSCAAIPIKLCSSSNALKVTNVKIYNATWTCTQEPCVIYKGSNLSVSISFENDGNDITDVTNQVYGIVLHITVPFPNYPADMKDVCKLGDSSSSCPIKKGDKFTEIVTLPITTEAISGMQIIAKWELMVDNAAASCFEVELKIG